MTFYSQLITDTHALFGGYPRTGNSRVAFGTDPEIWYAATDCHFYDETLTAHPVYQGLDNTPTTEISNQKQISDRLAACAIS